MAPTDSGEDAPAQLEVFRLERLVLIEVTQDLERVGDANVERIGVERLDEQYAGFLLSAHAHVEETEAVLNVGQHRPQIGGFLIELLCRLEPAALIETLG